MAMREQEQERRSPPPETARTASNQPQLLGLGPVTGRSAAAMATSDMAGGGAAEGGRGPEWPPDNIRSSSPWAALLSVVSSKLRRKPRSHVPRAAPSHPWGSKLPVVPPAPAKKKPTKKAKKIRPGQCELCHKTETPLWRTLPTDRRVKLCNACGIRVRTPGAVLPKHMQLPPPATATATTTVVSEPEQPPPQEIQDSDSDSDSESLPDSPILNSMLDFDVYLLRRTSPRRDKSPPPPPTAESAAAPAPAPDNKDKEAMKWCLHCGTTSSLQWRTGPAGPSTLCNPCGVRYRQGRLVPEYRPMASPTFNQSEHSNKHRDVIQLRKMQDQPAPPAAFQPSRNRKRRKGKEQHHQPAQVRIKKRKGSNDDQPAQPAAAAVLQVRKKSNKGKAQRQPPEEPELLKLRKKSNKGKAQQLPPPPPPAQPLAGYEKVRFLPLPPALLHAGDDMEMEPHLLLPPPALPQHAGDDMEQHLLPPPPAQPQVGDELMMGEPIPPLDPFLLEGPAAPKIIDDDEPVVVIVIDDD